jgi:hypothetical protein
MNTIKKTKSKGVRALMRALRDKRFLTRPQIESVMFKANNRGEVSWTPTGGYGKSTIDRLVEKEIMSKTKVQNGSAQTYIYSQGVNFKSWLEANL